MSSMAIRCFKLSGGKRTAKTFRGIATQGIEVRLWVNRVVLAGGQPLPRTRTFNMTAGIL
jgi:hypothetical protein